MRKKPRFLIGKAGVKIPFFEKKDELSLRLVSVDVKTSSPVPTADYINTNVDSAVNVKIGSSQEMLEKASQNFLDCGTDIIGMISREVLEGNMREIIGQN
nr:flotillin family protein [Anaerostipes caccae]